MAIVTVKEKGQLTLPASIRKRFNINKGDMLDVSTVGDKIIMTLQELKPKNPNKTNYMDILEYIGSMKGKFDSVEAIDNYIRNERSSWER